MAPRKPPRNRRRVYSHPKQASLAVRILDLIEATPGGMTFTQIQGTLFRWSNPDLTYSRDHRGWWCTTLYGGMYYGPGLLKTFCEKKGKRWVRNKVSHDDLPWKVMKPQSQWKAQTMYNTNAVGQAYQYVMTYQP
jgi:hypothetical protein